MPKRNLAWMLVVVVIALVLWQMPPIIAERDSVIRNFGTLNEVRTQILRDYVAPVDNRQLVDAAVRAAAEAMVHSLNDPHARYFDARENQRFERWSEGMTGGIGIDVGIIDGRIVVQTVAPGTPAAGAGLRHGDRIVAVEGQAVEHIGLLESISLLSGEPGQDVHLRIERPNEAPREATLIRVPLQINPIRGWRRDANGWWDFFLDRSAGIAYIRLTEFLRNAPAELDNAIHQTLEQGARAWILDLRENRGGLLDAAVEVADRFLKSGVIVSTRGRTSDERQWNAELDGTYPELPLFVLVNEWTASSAEIVAGAVRDHHRAEIVGERTYGKGSVQELFPLSDGSAIKLTTRHYYLPSGACIQKSADAEQTGAEWGVAPTIPVHMTSEQRAAWLQRWSTGDWGSDAGPASMPAATEASAEAERVRQELLSRVLKFDPQLRRALDELRGRLTPASAPDAGSPATGAARGGA